MAIYWLVIVFLMGLILLDAVKALKEFKRDKKVVPLVIHAVLLSILALLVINSLFAILNSEMEIPYFHMKIIHNSVQVYEL